MVAVVSLWFGMSRLWVHWPIRTSMWLQESGLAAEKAAERKSVKYIDLQQNQIFQPIAVENLDALSTSAMEFLKALGRRIYSVSGKDRESAFLFQRISVNIQRFNSILLHDSFADDDPVM